MEFSRRRLVQSLGAAATLSGVGPGLARAGATPRLDELASRLKAAHPSLRSIAVAHQGKTVLTHHHQLGLDDDTLHNGASVTKSVVSVLYGVAAQRGKSVSPEQRMVDVFPESSAWAVDPRLSEVKVKHVLSLSTGFDRLGSTVDSDYQDFQRRFYAPDFLRFALTRRLVHAPGERFAYANADAHLAAMILQRAVGQPLYEFADQALFAPLGIRGWQWARNAQGDVDGAATLRLRIPDMIRLGELVRSAGIADGKQLLPSAYVDEATRKHTSGDVAPRGPKPELWGYGYLWWTATTPITHQPAFFAAGYGGQFIYVAPALALTVAATTQQISRAEGAKTAALLREHVLPVFEALR